jgi:hypothetical protein
MERDNGLDTGRHPVAVEQAPSNPPRCQHCGQDPATILVSFTDLAGAKLAVFHCAESGCRAVYSVQMIGMAQPASRIVVPGV